MNAYGIAKELCKVKSTSSYNATGPFSPRVHFIFEFLRSNNIPFEVRFYTSKHTRRQLANIVIHFKGYTQDNIMYTAHHDIVNPDSENLNDNTASVCHLLALALNFKHRKPHTGVYIVLTDGEEIAPFGLGAAEMAKEMNVGEFGNVLYVINLELTGFGSEVWTDRNNTPAGILMTKKGAFLTNTPPNDAVSFREANIDAVCIGTVTKEDKVQIASTGMCDTWRDCHKKSDRMSNAIESDMSKFTSLLAELIPMPTVRQRIMQTVKNLLHIRFGIVA